MDSKHRHELKQNEFAMATMTVAERVAEHRRTILAVIGVVAVIAVIAGVAFACLI